MLAMALLNYRYYSISLIPTWIRADLDNGLIVLPRRHCRLRCRVEVEDRGRACGRQGPALGRPSPGQHSRPAAAQCACGRRDRLHGEQARIARPGRPTCRAVGRPRHSTHCTALEQAVATAAGRGERPSLSSLKRPALGESTGRHWRRRGQETIAAGG